MIHGVEKPSMRKVFDVIIGKRSYGVYNRDVEHQGYNGEPKTWWLYYADLEDGEEPNPLYWKPYSYSINRLLWDVRFVQSNYSKEKWESTNFSNVTTVEMRCNDKLIYEFSTIGNKDGLAYAMAKVQYMQVALCEHPFNFLEAEKEDGRKIWWRGLPATIKVSKCRPWEIKIIPDLSTGITEDYWWKELQRRESLLGKIPDEDDLIDQDDYNESRHDGYINWGDAYSDKYINWFRN